jgi:hypothetical protein
MSCAWIVAALVAIYWLPAAWAQGSGEDVHVTPRVEPTQTNNGQLADDPTLKTHTKPIKVDVNLVLVPVSIVDPENRQVTGLDKENFEVFEGKQRQQIQHFSSEDAPVSLGAIFDVSGSMASKIERAREAVVEFFKAANPEDEFFMIAFADRGSERLYALGGGHRGKATVHGSERAHGYAGCDLSRPQQDEASQVWEESTADHLRRRGQPQPLHGERDQELGKGIGRADLRHRHLQPLFPD